METADLYKIIQKKSKCKIEHYNTISIKLWPVTNEFVLYN